MIFKPTSQKLPGNKKAQTTSKMDHQHAVDTRCGFWMCSPDFMQPCAKVGFFTAFLSLVSLMTQTLVNYVNSQVTTLERQFGFNSHQTGIILAANDIGFLACVLFVGYLASRSHIPRSLGAAAIIYGLSGIACALPHFLFGAQVNADPAPESDNHTSSQLSQQMKLFGSVCDFNNSWTPCQNTTALKGDGRTNTVASASLAEKSLAIIVIGMALQGFGKGPRAAFSVTYLDGNTAKHNTGFYMGINVAVSVLGPAVAYLLGGVFSSMYVTLEDTKLTPRHPKWIGAWWLGYVVFGVLALVVAVPLFWFPRRLPRNKANVTQPDDETIRKSGSKDLTATEPPLQKSATVDPQDQGRSLRKRLEFLWRHSKEFLTSLCRLLTNPVFVCVVVSSSCTIFAVAGAGAFTPKYLESMFNLPTHQANFVMAVQTLCTSVVGSFLGGYLSRRLKMTAKMGVKFILISGGVGLVAHLLGFAFQCDQPTVHNWPSKENPCNSGCNCRDNSYFPICGGDGSTYYSPCHAGCPQVEQGVYQNCSCIIGGQATGGACDYGCSQLYVYAVAMGVRMLTATLIIIPKIIVTIRCVSEQDKAMSMAVHTFVTSLLGWLLAPIVFGDVIDSTCQIWDVKCQTTGRCLRYDNNLFRVNLHGYGAAGSALAFIFVLITYIYARYTKCLDDVVKDEIVQVTTEIALIAKDNKGENGLPVVEPEPNNNTTKNGGNKTQAEDA